MNVLNRLSFKAKLISLCLFLSAVSIVIAGIAFTGLKEVEHSYEMVTDEVMPNMNLVNDMFLTYRSVRINLRTLGLPGLPADEEEAAVAATVAAIQHYEEFNTEYEKTSFMPGERELYDDVHKNWLHFKGIGERALALHKSSRPEDRQKLMAIFFDDCPKAAKEYTAAVKKLKDFHTAGARVHVAESKKAAERANWLILSVAGLGILAGLLTGTLFAISMSKSITSVADALAKNAIQVTSTASQVAASSEQLSQAATEQAASLQQTAASLEQISAMITKASDGADTTSASSEESQRKAQEGRAVVDKMLSSIEEISQSNDAIMTQINESNQQMTAVVTVIQDIGNKTKVINEIVFQTKLLSFNASVEAARAGEHGKGFAVVAEEVGNLAQMSGNAAKEISDMLNESIPKVEAIVQQTKSRVEALITQARNKVDSGVDVAHQCSTILNAIVENVTRVSSLAKEISSASREQSQGVGEINKAMAQMDTVTQQNSSASEETAAAARALSGQAESLNAAVHQLAATIEGASRGESHLHAVSSPTRATNAKTVRRQEKHVTIAEAKSENLKKVSGDRIVPDRQDSGFHDI